MHTFPLLSVVKLDGMTKDEMAAVLKKFDIKSPLTNNALTEPIGKLKVLKNVKNRKIHYLQSSI